MKSVRLALLAALLACTPLVARAALLDFSFAFTNQQTQFLGGYVTGTVRGLTDDATSAASSVEILTNTSGFGLGEYIGAPLFNGWTVTGGVITAFSFAAIGSVNTPPAVTCCSLVMTSNGGIFLTDVSDPGFDGPRGPPIVTFTRIDVPEPATALTFATALALGALVLRRRRRAAA
jgi:hypothetical protein